MARGFLSGVLWGGIVSVGVAGVASVLAPPPVSPDVSDAAPSATKAPNRIVEADSGKQSSDGDRAPLTGLVAPQTTAPDPDTIAAIDADTLNSAAVPQTGSATALDAPATVTQGDSVAPTADEPVLPNPQALAPMEPQPADDLSISTQPAQPPAPPTEDIAGAFDAPAKPDVQSEGVQSAGVPEEALPAVDDQPETAAAQDVPATTAVAPTPDTPVDPDVVEPVIPPVAPPSIIVDATPDEAPDDAVVDDATAPTDTETDTDTASARPAIGTPAVGLTDRGGVTVNRLTADTDAQAAPAEGTADETTGALADGDLAPLRDFAQPFENPDAKPLMSIVLIDDGTAPTAGAAGIAALRSFPYPLSFAVDSALPDAAARMALYRDEGFEVLAMVDLPEGAAPSDAETTFGVTLDKLPQVVGVLEGTRGGLQGSRDVADQVTAILAGSGHGLVTQDRGLNTMPKLARKEGVPADPIFRDFDSKNQTAQVIRRFLDQAAFRAGQDGAVIMLGRLRPDTISALLLWGLQDRAGQVALAPISAVLLREE